MNALAKSNLHFNNIIPRVVGFDSIFRMLDDLAMTNVETFPPINIIKAGENSWLVESALAGYKRENLTVSVQNDQLIITGSRDTEPDYPDQDYVVRGISSRKFERRFNIPENAEVTDASFIDGILKVTIVKPVAVDTTTQIEIKG